MQTQPQLTSVEGRLRDVAGTADGKTAIRLYQELTEQIEAHCKATGRSPAKALGLVRNLVEGVTPNQAAAIVLNLMERSDRPVVQVQTRKRRRHVTNNGPWKCERCGAGVPSEHGLLVHLGRVHGVRREVA
jgi:predicted DNA-binding protein